jgi:hypothetical protein
LTNLGAVTAIRVDITGRRPHAIELIVWQLWMPLNENARDVATDS